MRDEKNPLDPSGKTLDQGSSDDTNDLCHRINRYSSAKARALQMLDYLREYKTDEKKHEIQKQQAIQATSRLADCGNYLLFSDYYTAGQVRLTRASFCKQHLICPLCAIRRGAKTLGIYLERYLHLRALNPLLRGSMITFTVRNGDDLVERFKHLQRSIGRLLERRRDFLKKGRGRTEFRKVTAFVGSYEITNKGKGWHPHAHVMVLHESSFDYSALVAEWGEITGDSIFVNVAPFQNPDDPARDFLEVFKYAVKFSDLSLADNFEAYLSLKGRRLLFSGGDFWGLKVPQELTDEALDDLEHIELFYVYSGGAGYSLKSAKKKTAVA